MRGGRGERLARGSGWGMGRRGSELGVGVNTLLTLPQVSEGVVHASLNKLTSPLLPCTIHWMLAETTSNPHYVIGQIGWL